MDRKRSKLKAMEGLNNDAKILVTKKDIPIIVEAFLTGIRASSEDEGKYKSKVDSSIHEDSDSNSEEDSSEVDEDEGENGFRNNDNDDLVMQNELKSEVASSIDEDSDSNSEEDSSDENEEDQRENDFENDESDDLVMQSEVNSEWPFFFVIAIDLGMEADGIKRMKSGLLAGTLASDAAGLSEMLLCWINNGGKEGNKEATWNNLISVISSNITLFPGHAKKDYVGILKQLHPGMSKNNGTHSSVMAVFNNNLIRDEILKYLPFEEKQHLRRLSRSFNELMLADWRKKLSAFCIGVLDQGDDNTCTFQDFYKFYEGNEALKLEEYPHRAIRIIKEDIVLYGSRFLKMQRFWDRFAENITTLEFKSCSFEEGGFINTLRWILFKACPNLESLKFTSYCKAILKVDDVKDLEAEKKAKEVVLAGNGGIAANLKNLEVDVHYLSDADEQILKYTPYVEKLSLCNVAILESLLKTRSLDEPLKLHTLTINANCYNEGCFLPLQRLSAQYPNSIKHLSILDLDFFVYRDPKIGPGFYQGIGQCQALSSLKLSFIQTDTLRVPWLIELSTMEFPQLKNLQIYFENEDVFEREVQLRFDFTALKGMSQLKTLSIVYQKPVKYFLRIQEWGGIKDWVYDGALEPSYLNKNNIFKNHSEDSLIKLERLEEFEFLGWRITDQDILLFNKWFPSLRILKTSRIIGFQWPYKLKSFLPKLEMLVIGNDDYELKDLISLRLKICKNVRFVVPYGKSDRRVELKTGAEDNKVYFVPY